LPAASQRRLPLTLILATSDPSGGDDYPGNRFPQFEQFESVTRFPVPHDGHRFMPSVLAAKGDSRAASSADRRTRRRIIRTATIPTIANATTSRSCVV
jgi:hypothetical protein